MTLTRAQTKNLDSVEPGQFSKLSSDLSSKVSVYDIKVTHRDIFPLKIYKSKILPKALDALRVPKKTRKCFKKLFKVKNFRKAVTYLFWMFMAMKFRERSFGDLDHYSGKDPEVKRLKDNRAELYKVLEADIAKGKSRRIAFVKYWRHKFQNHLYEVRNRYDKLFTKTLQEVLPFLIGRAIIVAFEEMIRFGAEILHLNDKLCAQVYQAVFMEIVGFKVDKVFILNWLTKHSKKEQSLDKDVMNFLSNKADFMREKALA